jgi:hypothetical protein
MSVSYLHIVYMTINTVFVSRLQLPYIFICGPLLVGSWITPVTIVPGDPIMLREMILSIVMHMQNVHVFPENTRFKQCSHLELPATGRDKKWLEPNSLVNIFVVPFCCSPSLY